MSGAAPATTPAATPASTEPYGNTPLTAESLGSLGHPLSLSDFNQDATGYWRNIRGTKTYYPREWFDQSGTFTGYKSQPGDPEGQGQSFFKEGTKWDWTKGQYYNPTNWGNVIPTIAAGGVGAGIAAPFIAGALGGGAAGGGSSIGSNIASSLTAGFGHGGVAGLLSNPLVTGGIRNIYDAARGQWSPSDLLSLAPTGAVAGGITNNPFARAALTSGMNTGLRSAVTGNFDPRAAAFDLGTSLAGPAARGLTSNPLGQRLITSGLNTGLNTAATGSFNPLQAGTSLGMAGLPSFSASVSSNPLIQRLTNFGGSQGLNFAGGGSFNPVQTGLGALTAFNPQLGSQMGRFLPGRAAAPPVSGG